MDKEKISKVEKAKQIASKTTNNSLSVIEESVFRFLRWFSSIIDRLFFTSRYAGIFALVLACLAYFSTTYDSSNSTLTSSKILTNVGITTRYNSGIFEITGVPTGCEIILTGEAGNVTNASNKKGFCQIDLEGYSEGTHTVKITAEGFGDNVNTTVSPSSATITLKKKTTMQFDLSYDFINQNLMDSRYILSAPEFSSTGKINIRASEDTLNSISLVKVLIDVAGVTNDFEKEVPLVAYDKSGKVVNAEIVPGTVTASVKVSSPSNEVPIKLNPTGSIPNGLAIDTVSIVDHQTTTIYAPENVLNTIKEVYVNFDLSSVLENSDKNIMLPVSLPTGVNASDVTVVNVKVSLATVSTSDIENVPINVHDNYNNLAISDIDIKDVLVTVSGSENNIALVSSSDIEVYFVMPETVGTYNVPLYVTCVGHPYVNLMLSSASVNVTVVEAN